MGCNSRQRNLDSWEKTLIQSVTIGTRSTRVNLELSWKDKQCDYRTLQQPNAPLLEESGQFPTGAVASYTIEVHLMRIHAACPG